MLEEDAVDWPTAELLALGTLLAEGSPVRFAGQDSRRGTFSQRHSTLIDHQTGAEHIPLQHLGDGAAAFMIYDSPLNEFAALGFEYGYSVVRKEALTIWEAQFGDFVNGAQVVIDQFIAAAEDKWDETSGLVMLLPHGYEGQGPEHSSARIERFLTLCAEDNIQVCQPTTAAQHFHLLRRQLHREVRKPLVIITPKSLLRAREVLSPAAAFTSGHFREILPEAEPPVEAGDVQRVFLTTGKVANDVSARRNATNAPAVVVRVEQLYPWPHDQMVQVLQGYPNATELRWVQDEPENMGAWPFLGARLYNVCEAVGDLTLRRSARVESASPAAGSHTMHEREQQLLLDDAFAGLSDDSDRHGAGAGRPRSVHLRRRVAVAVPRRRGDGAAAGRRRVHAAERARDVGAGARATRATSCARGRWPRSGSAARRRTRRGSGWSARTPTRRRSRCGRGPGRRRPGTAWSASRSTAARWRTPGWTATSPPPAGWCCTTGRSTWWSCRARR